MTTVITDVTNNSTIDGNNNTVIMGENNLTAYIVGRSNAVLATSVSGETVSLVGDDNSLSMASYAGNTAAIFGVANAVTASGDNINLGGASLVTVTGTSDTIGLFSSNEAVTAAGAHDFIYVASGLTRETLYVSNATIDAVGNDSVTIDGTSDVVDAGPNDTVSLSGSVVAPTPLDLSSPQLIAAAHQAISAFTTHETSVSSALQAPTPPAEPTTLAGNHP